MPDLILIRHSQTKQVAAVDSHLWQLTDAGRARCEALAAQLQPYGISRMFTSEETKACQTGELVATLLNIPCETAPNLHETERHTVPYSPNVAEFRAAVHTAMQKPDEVVFGEEAFSDARHRFAKQIDFLIEQYPDETLAVVTHGTVMSLYLAHLSGEDVYEIWQMLEMPAYAVVSLPQKQVTKIVNSVI